LLGYCDLTHQPLSVVRAKLIIPLEVGQGKLPTEQQLWGVVSALEAGRNRFMERLRSKTCPRKSAAQDHSKP